MSSSATGGHRILIFSNSFDVVPGGLPNSAEKVNVAEMPDSKLFLNRFRFTTGTPYAAGQTIIEAGTHGDSMYVVLDGEVEIRVADKGIDVVGPGSIFGEMALIDDDPRSATVIAKTDCRLAEVDRNRFKFMVSETPFFALDVMRVMADRLRKANTQVAGLNDHSSTMV